MVEEGTLARQEGAGDLQALGVPELRLLLLLLRVPGGFLLHLQYEPDLGRVAEI